MTTRNVTTPKPRRSRAAAPTATTPQLLEKLRARVEALGLLVVTNTEHEVFVVDPKTSSILCEGGGLEDLERWARELEAERPAVGARADSDAYAGIASAKAEIRTQFDQAYSLVSAAKNLLEENPREWRLLDMAEDVLGDLTYINRIDTPGGAS